MTIPLRRTLAAALLAFVLNGCSATGIGGDVEPVKVERTQRPPVEPPKADPKGWDWVQLTSDEWLKGEIKYMRDHSLLFDSDELDELTLKWRKIKVLKSPRSLSVLMSDLLTLEGPLIIEGDKAVFRDKDGFLVVPRGDVVSIVPSGKGGLAYWSGDLKFGLTLRSGNTDQIETTLGFNLRRRAPKSRIQLTYLGSFGKTNGVENVNNQRLTGAWNLFTSRRWFVTPFGFELYSDPFQNIDVRATPLVGAGYHIYLKGLDAKGIDWDVSALGGYRYTRFSSGIPNDDGTFTVVLRTDVDWELTEKLDLTFTYDIQIGIPDTSDTNQNLQLTLSFDAWKSLDLDVSFVWNFVGKPRADANGNVPENSDFRLVVGVKWEF